MRSTQPRVCLVLVGLALFGALSAPAAADHTDPSDPIVPIVDLGDEARTTGAGTWEHLGNFGGTTGTDLKFFHRNGEMYVAGGQIGQAQPLIVGQRMLRLIDAEGNVDPQFVADHGASYCGDVSNIRSTTGIQHDTAVTPRLYGSAFHRPGAKPNAELVIDTVDALGRCHDKDAGGLELIDISGLGEDGFEPREVHLTRMTNFSHTVTVDATRPWLVYNSNSDFGVDPDADHPLGQGPAWIDVLDIRSCLGHTGKSLEDKRAACRPKVFRMPFDYAWAAQLTESGDLQQPSACHDITTRPGKLFCAAPTATMVFDVSGLTDAQGPAIPAPDDPAGDIHGTPLPCTVVDAVPAIGGATAAKVTNCVFEVPLATPADQTTAGVRAVQAYDDMGRPAATGWTLVGRVNHPGRNCGEHGVYNCNTNVVTPANEGVAIAHEADPTPDGRWLFVTDERGGGVLPPGSTCAPSLDNPYGNGGLHVFDMTKKDAEGRFQYALTPDGNKAIYISQNLLPSPTFCTIHVIEQVPDEQRIMAAWYTQGLKILDYTIDADGRWSFEEVASYTPLPNDIWAAEPFKIADNDDGTRTYWFVSNDVGRGMDVFTWTGPRGPALAGTTPSPPPSSSPSAVPSSAPTKRPGALPRTPPPTSPATGADYGLFLFAVVLLPVALLVRRRVTGRG